MSTLSIINVDRTNINGPITSVDITNINGPITNVGITNINGPITNVGLYQLSCLPSHYCELRAQACQAVLTTTLHDTTWHCQHDTVDTTLCTLNYTFLLSAQGEMAHWVKEEVGCAVSQSVPASPAASVSSRKGSGKIQFLYGSGY